MHVVPDLVQPEKQVVQIVDDVQTWQPSRQLAHARLDV